MLLTFLGEVEKGRRATDRAREEEGAGRWGAVLCSSSRLLTRNVPSPWFPAAAFSNVTRSRTGSRELRFFTNEIQICPDVFEKALERYTGAETRTLPVSGESFIHVVSSCEFATTTATTTRFFHRLNRMRRLLRLPTVFLPERLELVFSAR